ncbi:hypothetical protein [Pseudomonas phage D6]|nr:hypothetical protein [Pseudomonas phage D6]
MFPIYWQGSVVGAIMGALLILGLGIWLIRSKADLVSGLRKLYRWLIPTVVLVAWLGSFINIGIHQVQGDRAHFDQVGTLTEKREVVRPESASPESMKKAAAELRKEIDAGNLDK